MKFYFFSYVTAARFSKIENLKPLLGLLLLLFLNGLTLSAQDPTVTVRFATPSFDCETEEYCVSVEFQSDQASQQLFGMNVRFYFDAGELEFIDFRNFEAGYNQVSPPQISTSGPAGPAFFNFSGPASYINGAVQLVNESAPPIDISTTEWTKLYDMCFTAIAPLPDDNFCPSIVWALQEDPEDGDFQPGSEGVVISVVNPDPSLDSSPADELVEQFNWAYTPNSSFPAEPAGGPQESECIVARCIDLELLKVVDNTSPGIGEDVVFTIEVENKGPDAATMVQVLDQLPTGFMYSIDDGGGDYDPVSGVWDIGDLAANASVSLEITATVLATGNYINLAEVSNAIGNDDSTPGNGADTDNDGNVGLDDDSDDEDDGDDAVVVPVNAPEIMIVKTGSFAAGADGFAQVGELITYSFDVTNPGNVSLTNVLVTDPLVGLSAISFTGGDADNDNELDVSETWTYTATYAVTQDDIDAGKVDNTATADSDESDPDSDDETTMLPQDPEIMIVKSGSFAAGADGFAQVGELISYTFDVTNPGNVSLTNVLVTDPLVGLSAISFTGGDADNDSELDVSETWTYTATYAVTQDDIDAGKVDNTATADSDESDPDSGDETTTLPQDAEIMIVKTGIFAAGADGFAQVGELISYTFDVTNPGNVSLTNVLVTDPLVGLSAISFTGGDADNDNELDVSETWTYTATYAVTQDDIDAGKVDNTATADSDESDPDSDDETTTLPRDAEIMIVKSGSFAAGGDGFAQVGELITYSFDVTNPGDVSLANVLVTDPLVGLSAISFTGGDADNDSELDVSETWTYTATYAVTQDDIDAGKVDNTATADSDESDPDSDDETTMLPQDAEIMIVKTGSFAAGADGFAQVGELISYTFDVTNPGNVSLTNVLVTDPLVGLSAISFTGGDADNDSELDVSETWTYTATYAVTQDDIDAGKVDNTATADSDESDPDSDDETTMLPQDAEIMIVKTGSFAAGADGFAQVGELITYSFDVTNPGNVSLTNVLVTDPLVGLSAISFTGGDADNDSELDVSETWTYTATYAVTQDDIDAGKVDNTATADSDESDPDSDDETTTLPQDAEIMIVKTGSFAAGGDGFAQVGELITYTFEVTNEGNISLNNIMIIDPLPGLSAITFTGGDADNDTELDVTETWTYSATYAITQNDINASVVNNTATVNSDESDPDEDDEITPLPLGCVTIEAFVYLEGAVITTGGSETYSHIPMRTQLNSFGLLPGQTYVNFFNSEGVYNLPGQPYSGAPWNYAGAEGSVFDSEGDVANADAGYPSTVVDWVLVSLRATPDAAGEPLCQSAALLHSDGRIEFIDGFNLCCGLDAQGTYYLVIEHRNHLIVMSDSALPIVGGTISYDFRTQQSYIDDFGGFGTAVGQKELNGNGQTVYVMFAGNGNQVIGANADTDVNFDDGTFWEFQNSMFGLYLNGDYNLDGDTNFNDRRVFEINNSKFTSVPRD